MENSIMVEMRWYHFIAYFFGGTFLINSVPHLVAGVSGNPFQTPFASPPGEGLSSSTVNVLWAMFKKLETEDTQIFGFTEIGQGAYNRPIGLAEASRMVGISCKSGPRRRVMSGQGSPSIPPRAVRPKGSFHSTGSGHS